MSPFRSLAQQEFILIQIPDYNQEKEPFRHELSRKTQIPELLYSGMKLSQPDFIILHWKYTGIFEELIKIYSAYFQCNNSICIAVKLCRPLYSPR